MNVQPIIDRLQATLGTVFKSIGGGADLDAAMAGAPVTPSLFVMTLADSAEPSEMSGETLQRITSEFGVFYVVANRRDTTGAAAQQDLEALRPQVRDALVGWDLGDENTEAVQYARGNLLRFDDGRLWWADVFRVRYYYLSPN